MVIAHFRFYDACGACGAAGGTIIADTKILFYESAMEGLEDCKKMLAIHKTSFATPTVSSQQAQLWKTWTSTSLRRDAGRTTWCISIE